jgi:hypothetical protein
MADLNKEYYECQCYSDEHTLKFVIDDEECELYASVFLHQYRNIFKRIWVAIKYVFGYKCKYGHWDCFMMQDEDIDRFKQLGDKMFNLYHTKDIRNKINETKKEQEANACSSGKG